MINSARKPMPFHPSSQKPTITDRTSGNLKSSDQPRTLHYTIFGSRWFRKTEYPTPNKEFPMSKACAFGAPYFFNMIFRSLLSAKNVFTDFLSDNASEHWGFKNPSASIGPIPCSLEIPCWILDIQSLFGSSLLNSKDQPPTHRQPNSIRQITRNQPPTTHSLRSPPHNP